VCELQRRSEVERSERVDHGVLFVGTAGVDVYLIAFGKTIRADDLKGTRTKNSVCDKNVLIIGCQSGSLFVELPFVNCVGFEPSAFITHICW
jgi:hypothetical protein